MTARENRPTQPGTEAPVDAFAELAAKLRALYEFVDARAAEEMAPQFWKALGYAYGSAETHLDCGDIVGAVRQFAWLRIDAA
ncbi:hypothetical protein [Streptomyces paludis]|uniref:Uncharacterized protein n=1 Tax=Streptomyces paludis TaxID=2282738 RepID=A0A345HPI9_9ACTN|nr:hypothetical protein [Streptomyces paludis]AXG78613.1 hypothetical protein DVK44_13835 [Streptomyces paludis]